MTTQTQVRSTEEALSIEDTLKLALEAMNAILTHMGMDEDEWNKVTFNQMRKAIKALEEALAKQEQGEPVAIVDSTISGHIDWLCTFFPEQGTRLYTTPQQRTWVGLTDEEYLEAESVVWVTINLDSDEKEANREFYKAIEAKLKEKNFS